jgi:ABC-type multidrug transport system fused ATPase/permease subunit
MMDAERLLGILKTKPSIVDKDDAKSLQLQTGEVKFNDVKFDYGQKAALKGVTINVPGGKTVGIVGLSGSGKSTIMKLLTRFYDPKKGSIQINGQEIRNVTLKRYVILKTLYLVWRLRVTVFVSI